MADQYSGAEYIEHHLEHLVFGRMLDGSWQFAANPEEATQMGLWAVHADSLLVSFFLGFLCLGGIYLLARRFRVEGISKTQAAVELLFFGILDMTRETYRKKGRFVPAFAMAIGVWVFAMNTMDVVPVDFLPTVLGFIHPVLGNFKSVPTADFAITLPMGFAVFGISIFYSFYHRGKWGLAKDLLLHPFPKWYMAPLNLVIELVTLVTKPISLALRLWGNIFAGELIFLLISAFVPFWAAWTLWLPWAIFHLLVIALQAYIFVILSLVYFSQAAHGSDSH